MHDETRATAATAATTPPATRTVLRLRLAWILALAAAVRVIWIVLCPNEPISDQVIYHSAAVDLAHGRGFLDDSGNPHGWWPVGYPAALTPFYWLLGDTPRSDHVANLVFALALVGGVHELGRRLFGATAAAFAALVAALHPTMVMLTTVLVTENLFLPMSVWGGVLVVASVGAGRLRWGPVLGAGALFGLGAYVRAPGLLLVGTLFLWPLLCRAGWSRALQAGAAAAVVAIATLLPWGFRTQAHFGTFQVVSMNGGSNLWMGNHPGSDGGYTELPADIGGLSIPEREAELRRRALAFVRAEPLEYVRLCVRRLWTTLRSDTVGPTWNEPGLQARGLAWTATPLRGVCTLAFHALNALALAGLWWRRRQLGRADGLLLAQLVLAAVPFTFIVGGNRYHLPLAPSVWLLAGAGVAFWLQRRAARAVTPSA